MELQLIRSKIYELRGMKVMLDVDLAELYGVETKRLKEIVRRNMKRFPHDFMFELDPDEWQILRTQFATSSWGGTRYAPFAFTEQGVAMLSGLLNSDIAIEMNIAIMRAFIAMRQLILKSPEDKFSELQTDIRNLKATMDEFFCDQNDINEDTRMQIELINQSLAELQSGNRSPGTARKRIGFNTEE